MGQFRQIHEKKSLSSTFGKIAISNDNALLNLATGHRVSPLLGERLVYIGQLDSYEKGSEIAANLLNLQVSDSKIYRLTDAIGQESAEWLEEEDLRDSLSEQAVVYAQMDGSMILTREQSWKEVKLGRVFGSGDLHEESESRNWLKASEYIAHLGDHKTFENAFSKILDPYSDKGENLVFINDGAKWQWNWIDAEYPQATQVLDFYHAMEHIGSFVSLLKNGAEKTEYLTQLGQCLKDEGIEVCWQKIAQLDCRTKTQMLAKQKLKTYIDNNRCRMNYPQYLKRKLLIGSGAVESAHRTVIQKRMKLAGQRWSKKGAKNMLNLRVLNMSGHWDRVQVFYRNAA